MIKNILLTITVFMFSATASVAKAEGAAQPSAVGTGIGNFFLVISFILIMYVIIIRPQSKRLRAHRDMVEALKQGDKIITNGGIHGTITAVDEETMTVSVADGVKIKFSREATAINLTASASTSSNKDTK